MKKIDVFNHIWPKPFHEALIRAIGDDGRGAVVRQDHSGAFSANRSCRGGSRARGGKP